MDVRITPEQEARLADIGTPARMMRLADPNNADM